MLFGRNLLVRRLQNIRKEIDKILKEEELTEAFTPIPTAHGLYETIEELKGKAMEIEGTVYKVIEKAIGSNNASKMAPAVQKATDEGFLRKLGSYFEKVVDFVRDKVIWLKDKIIEYAEKAGGMVKDKIGSLYEKIVEFSKTNPYISLALVCFIIMMLLAILYNDKDFDLERVIDAFRNAFAKVVASIKETWSGEGITSKLYAVLKVIFSPVLIIVQVFEEYEDASQLLALGSLCIVFFLFGYVYFTRDSFQAVAAKKSRLHSLFC